MSETRVSNGFPTLAGVLFGLGLGGFFDGIVLHQLLQWHHMLSNWYPIVDVAALQERLAARNTEIAELRSAVMRAELAGATARRGCGRRSSERRTGEGRGAGRGSGPRGGASDEAGGGVS
jgi:Predicted membrane protein (DUF2243)